MPSTFWKSFQLTQISNFAFLRCSPGEHYFIALINLFYNVNDFFLKQWSLFFTYLATDPFIQVWTDSVPTREMSTTLDVIIGNSHCSGCGWPVNRSLMVPSDHCRLPKSLWGSSSMWGSWETCLLTKGNRSRYLLQCVRVASPETEQN